MTPKEIQELMIRRVQKNLRLGRGVSFDWIEIQYLAKMLGIER